MLLIRHYDQRPFDGTRCNALIANGDVKTPSKKMQNICDDGAIKHGSDFSYVCDAIITNDDVKTPSKKMQNVCDDGCIKHGSKFSCVCDEGHTVQFNELFAMRQKNING